MHAFPARCPGLNKATLQASCDEEIGLAIPPQKKWQAAIALFRLPVLLDEILLYYLGCLTEASALKTAILGV